MLRGVSTAHEWDNEYRAGRWDSLLTADEQVRYQVLAGCVTGGAPDSGKRVLDLGCGTGILRGYLPSGSVESYTGVDWSAAAVEQARDGGHDRSDFHAASVVDWEPDGSYDAIVFNEVLYYLPSPESVALRYSASLRPGGSMFVSMWSPSLKRSLRPAAPSIYRARLGCWRIWRALGRRFEVVNDIVVERSAARRWRIKELRHRGRDQRGLTSPTMLVSACLLATHTAELYPL
jgi:SAM-dependent methyltransferase